MRSAIRGRSACLHRPNGLSRIDRRWPTLALAAFGALLGRALAVQPTLAGHESRDRVLSESGVEILLIVLVLVAAIADVRLRCRNPLVGAPGRGVV